MLAWRGHGRKKDEKPCLSLLKSLDTGTEEMKRRGGVKRKVTLIDWKCATLKRKREGEMKRGTMVTEGKGCSWPGKDTGLEGKRGQQREMTSRGERRGVDGGGLQAGKKRIGLKGKRRGRGRRT